MQGGDTHQFGGLKLIGKTFEAGAKMRKYRITLDDNEAIFSAKYDKAIFVGDKFPVLFRHFSHVFERFPDARHTYVLRNPLSVAASYDARFHDPKLKWDLDWKAGLAIWNESVRAAADLPAEKLENFTFVSYEVVLAQTSAINALFASLGLATLEPDRLMPFTKKFASLNNSLAPRREDLRFQVAQNAAWDAYQKLCSYIEPSQVN